MSGTWMNAEVPPQDLDNASQNINQLLETEGDATEVVEKLLAKEQLEKQAAPIDEDDRVVSGEVQLHHGEVLIEAEGKTTQYTSETSFADIGLDPKILLGIKEMNWDSPSRIQGSVLPLILKGHSIIAQAHHGSGKTGAFSLGMLSTIDIKLFKPQAILLVNTRELAAQCLTVLHKLGLRLGAAVYLAVGSDKGTKQSHGPITQQIIVGTPGRVRNLVSGTSPQIDPKGIKMIVFDEADVLLNVNSSSGSARGGRGGRGGAKATSSPRDTNLAAQALEIRGKCASAQTLLFSATFDAKVMQFAKELCPTAISITLKKEEVPLDNITQIHIDCTKPGATQDNKIDVVEDILEANSTKIKQTIIFCNSINSVKLLTNTLRMDGFPASCLHSKLTHDERTLAGNDFRTGKTKVLIATNIISRGLDVPDVSLVINFDIPVHQDNRGDSETYLHRIGRCGRFGRKGCALALTFDQSGRSALGNICSEFSMSLTKIEDNDGSGAKDIMAAINNAL